MNNDEMIAKYLKSNKVNVCDEAIVIDTHRLSNKTEYAYSVAGVGARNVAKFKCILCGEEDSVVKDFGQTRSKGYVAGEYKGDTLCWLCRKEEIKENKRLSNIVLETQRLFNGNTELMELYNTTNKLYRNLDSRSRCELITIRDNFAECIAGIKINKRKEILTKKINMLNNRIDKLPIIPIDNWEDWDIPLGENND